LWLRPAEVQLASVVYVAGAAKNNLVPGPMECAQASLRDLQKPSASESHENVLDIAGASLGRSHMRPAEVQLVSAVYGTGAAKSNLVPGLMKCYTAAGRVVGLDVDRDRYDKFGFRDTVGSLLMELWKDEGKHPPSPPPPTPLRLSFLCRKAVACRFLLRFLNTLFGVAMI